MLVARPGAATATTRAVDCRAVDDIGELRRVAGHAAPDLGHGMPRVGERDGDGAPIVGRRVGFQDDRQRVELGEARREPEAAALGGHDEPRPARERGVVRDQELAGRPRKYIETRPSALSNKHGAWVIPANSHTAPVTVSPARRPRRAAC